MDLSAIGQRVWSPGRRFRLWALLLLVVYLVGELGLAWPTSRALFQALVPLNLAFTLAVLSLFHADWSARFGQAAALVALAGFGVELLGIHTGAIFGHYAYGASLGPKLLETPPIIGLNWLMLVYGSAELAKAAPWRSPLARACLGASLMVALDFLIEPVAMRTDMWDWQGGAVPLRNYVAWWLTALLLHLFWQSRRFEWSNPMGGWVFLLQVAFFLDLNLLAWLGWMPG